MYEELLECLQEARNAADKINALYQKMEDDPTNPVWEKTMPNGLNLRDKIRLASWQASDAALCLWQAKEILEYKEP
jgi:hypothetical protein